MDGQIGNKFLQIHHPGADGVHALGLQLRLGRAEIALDQVRIHVHHQRAVVIAPALVLVEGVAGEFAAVGQQIVPAGALDGDAQRPAGGLDDRELAGDVVIRLADEKGEVQISAVMKNSAAAGEAAGQVTALLREEGGPAFFPGILVSADDHGAFVLPEIEDQLPCPDPVKQGFLQGEVFIGVGPPAPTDQQLPDHACSQRRIGVRAALTSSGRPIWA